MDALSILNQQVVQCGLCGAGISIQVAPAAEEVEPPDYDTRPGETIRSTLPFWIQGCRDCGYAASDITTIHEDAVHFVGTDTYQRIRHDSTLPEKARQFLCYSAILDLVGQTGDAGWSALHAAWICDDAGDDSGAVRCRTRALELWKKCKASGESFGDDLALEFTVVTDVCRRIAAWEEAVVTCSEALDSEDLPPLLADILRQEKALIDRKDRTAHSLKELPPFRERFSIVVQ